MFSLISVSSPIHLLFMKQLKFEIDLNVPTVLGPMNDKFEVREIRK